MATSPNRWSCVDTLIGLLEAAPGLEKVQISPGFPGDVAAAREAIWADAIEGTFTPEVLTGPRRTLDDHFTIPFTIRIAGHRDFHAAMNRMDAVLAAAYQPLVDGTSTLEELDGVVSAIPSRLRGPMAGQTPSDGVVVFAELTVEVHTRID